MQVPERTVSIRLVVVGVALAVTVLLGVLGTVLIRQAHERMTDAAEQTMTGYARLVALAHSQWVAESEVLLASLAGVVERGEVASGQCTYTLSALLRRAKGYDTFLIAGPDGDVWCGPRPLNTPVNVADRSYFKQALASHAFTAGEYIVGRVSGVRTLPLAYPLMRPDGEVAAVIVAGKKLAWFREIVATLDMPTETHVALIDGTGATLAHYPGDASDDEIPRGVRDWAIQATRDGETSVHVGPGHGGDERIHAFSPLGEVMGAGVVISLPSREALAPVHTFLIHATIALASALALSILLLLLVLRGTILIPVARLLAGMREVRAGNRTWRTRGKAGGSTEMTELYRSFDGMLTELNF
ncbi:MAG TPA: hypothetical protein VLL76_01840, partial [Candidatus Omnitrophota bacterium]|nr:hypothetical protein [Candidatus Omnitrophota bacterium]